MRLHHQNKALDFPRPLLVTSTCFPRVSLSGGVFDFYYNSFEDNSGRRHRFDKRVPLIAVILLCKSSNNKLQIFVKKKKNPKKKAPSGLISPLLVSVRCCPYFGAEGVWDKSLLPFLCLVAVLACSNEEILVSKSTHSIPFPGSPG